jgi:membrane-associated protease RseP (regulator of RpoE activity)
MTFALGIVVFIIILVVSVAWHELGHLIPAKAFGIKVSQYMVGFGPTMVSWKRGDTEYGIKWILLGGYIRMAGMYSPVASPKAAKRGWWAALADEARSVSREELAGLPPRRAFYRLSAPRKLVVMLGGPTMNLILALILTAIAVSGIGISAPTTQVSSVTQCFDAQGNGAAAQCGPETIEGPAADAGIRQGDTITGWNGQPLNSWDDLVAAIAANGTAEASVSLLRDGSDVQVNLRPLAIKDGTDSDRLRYVIGLSPAYGLENQPLSAVPGLLGDQIAGSVQVYLSLPVAVWNTTADMIQGRDRDPASPMSILGVARVSGEVGESVSGSGSDTWKLRWLTWLILGASLNIALWLFNLLPLPPLDGGHVVNALFEGARRQWARWTKRPDPGPSDGARLMPVAYVVFGLLIVMTLVLVAADLINPVQV